MTWSILAREPETGLFGLAVASRFFSVGSIVPWSGGPHGAAMTQALPNPELGPRALMLLGQGHTAASVVEMLVAMDRGSDQRQIHVIDATGATAAHSGENCVGWFGHASEPGVSVAGNMLTGEKVLEATLETYRAKLDQPIVERLLAAIRAGQEAGGDKRGKQAASLRVQGPECYPRLDLRVDDHAEPLDELARLYSVAQERFIPFSASFPRRERVYGLLDRGQIEEIVRRDAGKPLTAETEIPEA